MSDPTPTPDFSTTFARAVRPMQLAVGITGVAVAILALYYIGLVSQHSLIDDRIAAAAQVVQHRVSDVDAAARGLLANPSDGAEAYTQADQSLTKAINDLAAAASPEPHWNSLVGHIRGSAELWARARADALQPSAGAPHPPDNGPRDQLVQDVADLSVNALSDNDLRSDKFIYLTLCVAVVSLAVLILGWQRLAAAGAVLSAAYAKGALRQEQIDALRRHRALLLTTLHSMGDGMIAVDKGDRITFVNSVAEKMTGLIEPDAVGRDAARTINLLSEKTRERIDPPFDKVIGDGIDQELPPHSLMVARDGTRRPITGRCVPVWDEKESIVGAALIFHDASESQAARKALQASSAYRDAILDAALDCIVVLDGDGRIVEYNPAAEATFGHVKRDVLGRVASDLIAAGGSGAQKYFQMGDPANLGRRFEFVAVRKSGEQFPVEMAVTAVPGVDPPMYVAYLRDIGERVKAEQTLRDAKDAAESESAAKSLFLNDMSDELRTPLNAVIGYSEILQEEAAARKADGFLPDLRKIHNAGRHLLTLVNDVLDLSKIESGKMELYVDEIDVSQLVEEIVAAVQPLLDSNENTLTVNCPASVGRIQADRVKVRQSVLYLISNAARFAQKRQLSLAVTREKGKAGEQVTFKIADNSPGIASEQSEKLVEALSSTDRTRTYRFGGHGLGLVIAKQLTEMMGGRMEVTREVGHSPTFFVHVPTVVNAPAK